MLIVNYTFGDRFCRRAGFAAERKEFAPSLLLSILFAVGSTVTFCILGMLASALGGLLERAETVLHFAMSILLVLMALQMWEVIRIIPSGNSVLGKNPFNRRRRSVHIRNNCRIVCFALCAADSFCFDGDCC